MKKDRAESKKRKSLIFKLFKFELYLPKKQIEKGSLSFIDLTLNLNAWKRAILWIALTKALHFQYHIYKTYLHVVFAWNELIFVNMYAYNNVKTMQIV